MTNYKKPNLLYRIRTFIYTTWTRYQCGGYPLVQEAWFKVCIRYQDGDITGYYTTDVKEDKEIVGYKWKVELCTFSAPHSASSPKYVPSKYETLVSGYTLTEKAARLRVIWYTWYYRLDQILQFVP